MSLKTTIMGGTLPKKLWKLAYCCSYKSLEQNGVSQRLFKGLQRKNMIKLKLKAKYLNTTSIKMLVLKGDLQ